MAVDFQGLDFTAKTFPYAQPLSFNESRFGAVPWGQAIVNESFQTTTIGAGNEGLIAIDVGLPSDYVAMLRTFYLGAVDTANIAWQEANLGMAYQQPGGPYKESVTDYPEDEYTWFQLISDQRIIKDRFATNRYIRTWAFSYGSTLTSFYDAGSRPYQIPLWIPPSADANFVDRSIVMNIENTSASQPAAEMTLRLSFDLFTFEQAYSASVMSSPRVFS